MREKIQVLVLAAAFFIMTAIVWLKPSEEISDSELRKLAQFPEVNTEKLLSGVFMSEFEAYSLDQFPAREAFRSIKAFAYLYLLGQSDNNGIYIEDGYAVKMEYPLSEDAVSYAISRFDNVYDRYLSGSDSKVYVAVIPDKNYYLADEHGALTLDYDTLFSMVREGMDYAEYIDLTGTLSAEDYYKTDTHWNQISIKKTADTIADAMGVSLDTDYTVVTLHQPFYGVYYGQAALPLAPDTMQYLTNEAINSAYVYDWQNGKEINVYNEEAMNTRAPYDLFLGGSLSLITIENDKAGNDRELIVFRDSFGSSMIPLLISGYSKITIVDIRYLSGDRLESFIDFHGQDVLFMYSTTVLNNGTTIK